MAGFLVIPKVYAVVASPFSVYLLKCGLPTKSTLQSKNIIQCLIGMQLSEKQIFLEFPFSKNSFDQKNPTCLSRGYSPLSGIYGHTTVYNSAMHSFYVYGGVSYSAGRVQVSNALFVLHYPTRRWSVVSTGCYKNTEKCIFIDFKGQLNSE